MPQQPLKTKIKVLFTESFFPYLFLIITLIIALLVIDRKIENQDDVVTVNLNREEVSLDEQPTIQQKINPDNLPGAADETTRQAVKEINSLIDRRQWKAALKNIENLSNTAVKNDSETRITQAFLYLKAGDSQKGIEVLSRLGGTNNPRFLYNMGLLYSRHARTYPEAIQYFEKFLALKKSSYEAFMNIAHLHYRSGRYAEALNFYKKSEELSNMARKARALYWIAQTQLKMKDSQKALENLDLAIHHDPELVQARVRRAELSLKSDPEKSVEELKKLIQAYPEYLETYHVLTNYYSAEGDAEKGLYWLKKGLENAPNSTQIKSGIGVLYLKLKEYEKAKQLFTELTDQFQHEETYFFNLARSYFGLGDYMQAAEIYQKALKLRPQYYEVFINLGIVYAKMNNPEKAIYYYNKALGMNPGEATIYYNMGILYSKLDQKQAALNAYQKALAIQKNYPEAYFNMAVVYNRLGDYKNSAKSYGDAIEYKKDYVNAYSSLANLYELHKEPQKAIELLNSGIKITQDLKLINQLAQDYESAGDNKNARKLYMEILEKDPENTEALYNVAKLFMTLKDFSQSKKYIDRYLSANPKNTEARYILMVDAYNLGKFDQAWNQWEILERMSPNYKDIAEYKTKIISNMN